MKINILSDLHLGFASMALPDNDANLLILAGDIARPQQALDWAAAMDKPVLYVPGNHEYYGSDLTSGIDLLRKRSAGTCVDILHNTEVFASGVRFLGTTLWTDFRLFGTGALHGCTGRAPADGYRVVCPDTIGRGLSQWSPLPDEEYCLAFYTQLAVALLDQLDLEQVDWVGTSMGGSIGLVAAAGALRGRIGKLVLNDNGPELAQAAIDRIRSYAGNPSAFATVSELEQYFRTVYKPYGDLTDAQWRHLTETSTRRLPDGRVTPHYDPAMVQQFVCHPHAYLRWGEYDSLDIPVLCLRGENSDLLLPETAVQMAQRGPRARVETIAGCGHAPALNVPGQLALITGFLRDAA